METANSISKGWILRRKLRVSSLHRVAPAIRRRLTRKPRAYFLHVPKTGGSAIKAALRPKEFSGRYHLVFHKRMLSEIPEGEPFFFGVRDPVTRFVSGFYGRRRHYLRQQQVDPRRLKALPPKQTALYQRYSTANELAVALSSPDDDERAAAEAAMGVIHYFRSYWERFGDEDDLLCRSGDLLMILFQERLDEDFEILTGRLGLTASLPRDDVAAHRNPVTVDRLLTETAVQNLRRWYRRDYDFLDLCKRLRFG